MKFIVESVEESPSPVKWFLVLCLVLGGIVYCAKSSDKDKSTEVSNPYMSR